MKRLAALLGIGALLAGQASGRAADEPKAPRNAGAQRVAVQAEDHTNFGRLDVTVPGRVRYRIERDGDHVSIRFDAGTKLSDPDRLPRNVLAAKASGAILDLTLARGASVHPRRDGGHVLFDVFDVPAAAKPQAMTGPKPAAVAAAQPMSSFATSPELGGRAAKRRVATAAKAEAPVTPPPSPAPSPAPSTAPAAALQLAPAPVMPVQAEPAPPPTRAATLPTPPVQPPRLPRDEKTATVGRDVLPGDRPPSDLIARRVRMPPDAVGTAILLPFDATTGAAAFQVGDVAYVVFDQRRQVSLSLLSDDPLFHGLAMRLLPAATVFQLQLPPNQHLALGLVPQGWRLIALPATERRQAITPTPDKDQVILPADLPGSVVTLADPDTGATLLIGTQRRPGQAVLIPRRTTQFILRAAIQGIVVEPLADTLQMQAAGQGFALSSTAGRLAVSPETPATQASIAAAHLSRATDLPAMRPKTLLRRIGQQFLAAGATPPLSRGPLRRAAAESLMSLGFAAEADGLLQLATAQDPQEADRPATKALMSMAALLAGRPAEADGLDDPRLAGIDEIDFWKAVRQAMADEGSPPAAAVFATTGPLATAYPKPIAEHLLPLVIETMLLGGEIQSAERLMDARPNDPRLAYARALRRQADGDTDGALAMLDRLAQGHDQFDRLRGPVHAIELRLKTGRITAAQAADGLDKLLIAWRGDDRELALRERIADLRGRSGAWRVGLGILRDAEKDFPERAAAIRDRLQTMFGAMMRDGGGLSVTPLDFVATVDENVDLMPRYENDPEVQQALLDRLMALDLPDRAIPLLRKLLAGATTEVAKARFGATLAVLQDREGHGADAIATLDATETGDAPPELAESRILTRASAMAHGGDRAGAIALLAKLATPGAAARRADLQEQGGDWAAAEAAWRDVLTTSAVPASGPVSAAITHTLLRLAAAASRAGDDAALLALRQAWMDRLAPGPDADGFRLLTDEPVRSTDDLSRSKEDVGLAASLAAAGKTVR
ncbi:MAG TPA: hypothetical protein VHB27_21260 [Rhodopila sp.]|uniref:hypothetical protein n=1 Tax=Rhodopila sp. TaxID=2480087 RepID=UPI002BE21959|nr:hypothetical protein [Rhodopila sp.]HVY17763.1 hypothetical protein [Rhodopila sp.]